MDGSSPDVAVRAGRVHAVAAPNGGGGGGDDSPQHDGPRDPWLSGNDPWMGSRDQPNHSRFGTGGAGGT
eukprot:1417473-Amphidinium_carterae.1